jgi:DNA-binding winged helix-turn-helix (wHTH) protein
LVFQARHVRWKLEQDQQVLVRDDGKRFILPPKEFLVINHLLMNAGKIVTTEELLDTAWKDTDVLPESVSKAVSELRKKLGDTQRTKAFIETIPTRGYRFIARSGADAEISMGATRSQLRSGQQVEGVFQALPHIEHLIMSSDEPIDFFVSAIYGDVTEPFLRRLFELYEVGRGDRPRLRSVVIKHPSHRIATEMSRKGQLRAGYWAKLQNHLGQIEECLRRFDTLLDVFEWASVPSFHGYVCGDHAFRGQWEPTEVGILNTRTPMTYFAKQQHPEQWTEMAREFRLV